MAMACFGLLWKLGSHPFRTGWLFAVYLILAAGGELLLIEQVRVNPPYDLGLFRATQAELTAVTPICARLAGIVFLGRAENAEQGGAAATPPPSKA